ncbi:hypothetical protein [Flavobacterium poyangense]|uniref:hypothetical protein n=1 Tax=Flavobacterium poyangense TaxID=2204302 RepID=UPI0014249CB0|nr:hypothetical protein [Flavobacterium sp. JXAS1]
MKNIFFAFLFFIGITPRLMSQTWDVSISYITREVQIALAKGYNKKLTESTKKITEYYVHNAVFYESTKTRGNRASSFRYSFPSSPCSNYKNWGPIKRSRCQKKIALLRQADQLIRSIPLASTSYSDVGAVNSRITFKASSILRDINKELLNNY